MSSPYGHPHGAGIENRQIWSVDRSPITTAVRAATTANIHDDVTLTDGQRLFAKDEGALNVWWSAP